MTAVTSSPSAAQCFIVRSYMNCTLTPHASSPVFVLFHPAAMFQSASLHTSSFLIVEV